MFGKRSGIRRLVAAAAVAVAAACTPVYSTADPFAGGGGGGRRGDSGIRDYRIRVEVGCDECIVLLTVGAATQSNVGDWNNQVWSASFTRRPLIPEAIRVTATPAAHSRSSVRFVRIYVDGKLTSSAECQCDDVETTATNDGRIMSAETVIPPENR